MSLVSWLTPWKPATIATAPSSRAPRMRPGVTSMMRALPCDDVGDHAGLAAGERPRLDAEVVDRHRQQGHRDALAGGEQHVELAGRRHRRHLLGEVDQLVGGVTHGRHDHARRRGRPCLASTMRGATRLMLAASATEEPPYFCTTSPTTRSFPGPTVRGTGADSLPTGTRPAIIGRREPSR